MVPAVWFLIWQPLFPNLAASDAVEILCEMHNTRYTRTHLSISLQRFERGREPTG